MNFVDFAICESHLSSAIASSASRGFDHHIGQCEEAGDVNRCTFCISTHSFSHAQGCMGPDTFGRVVFLYARLRLSTGAILKNFSHL